MEINRHNFEACLLDLLEERLSVEDQQKLQDFLLLNPDCAGELREIEPWVLEGRELRFQNKGRLKKNLPHTSSKLSDHNFDLFSIARMEGDLSPEQQNQHQAMVSADKLKSREWREWQQTRLVPGEVSFKRKDKLKHDSSPKRSLIWISVISTAAAIALLLFLFRTGPDLPQPEQALETSGESADIQARMDVQEEIQQVAPSSPEQPIQREHAPVVFSAKKEQERPAEPGPEMAAVPRDLLKSALIAGSVERINASSPVGEAVPDRIESLHIPPGKIHISSLTLGQIYDMDLQEVVENYAQEKDFSLLTLASAGIKGINKVAGSDISLMTSRNEEGKVSGIRLRGKRFSFSKPLGQEE